MVGTWGFTEATNIVEVTDGTSGTPATFADFVTADRAGTAELLAATSCAKAMTLTYAVRPVELRALQVSFVIAAKTAETDYIYITGTDAWGTALYEALDISAGNGTYVSTRRFATITNIDIEDVGDGSGTAAADGTLQVTQGQWGVVWDNGNGFYKVDCSLNIGNGSTATHFTHQAGEAVDMTGFQPQVTASATFNIGEVSNTDYAQHGAFLRYTGGWSTRIWGLNNATTNLNCAVLYDLDVFGGTQFGAGAGTVVNIFNSILTADSDFNYFKFTVGGTCSIRSLYIYASSPVFQGGTITVSDLTNEVPRWGVTASFVNTVIEDSLITNDVISKATLSSANTLTFRNPRFTVVQADLDLGNASAEVHYENTVNIHITDKDGANLQSATVTLDGSDSSDYDTQDFSVSTAADGTITEQNTLVKKWVGTSETETDYNVFRLTVSKAGYETLMLENITIDSVIDWHLELQAQKQSPAPWQEGMM